MVFYPPEWVPEMPVIPDVPIYKLMQDEAYGRAPLTTSRSPYICGITGREIKSLEQIRIVDNLAKALSHRLKFHVNHGKELDKVVAIFAPNTIHTMSVHWAVQRLNGVISPVNSVFTVDELSKQLSSANAKALFTTRPLLQSALEAAKRCSLPEEHVFILELPGEHSSNSSTVSSLVSQGEHLPPLEESIWPPGQGQKQIAYLCFSSGTTGNPKGVMISHHNLVANIVQLTAYESKGRGGPFSKETVLGLLPQSHIYGIVVISLLSTYRGDSVIILPKFDVGELLQSVERFKVTTLCLVPPMITSFAKSVDILRKFDLGSVRSVISGGGPLSKEATHGLHKAYPLWAFRQAYGLTEAAACITHTSGHDVWLGSSGSLLPGASIRLLDASGQEICHLNTPGEVFSRSPSTALGYSSDPRSTRETFIEDNEGRWLRTGDIGEFRRSADGNDHLFILDRLKDIMKVKGFQVSPSELEACLLSHESVLECAVLSQKRDGEDELPMAVVVKRNKSQSDQLLSNDLMELIRSQKAKHKWLTGGIQFVDSIPKSPSGKILKKELQCMLKDDLAPPSKL